MSFGIIKNQNMVKKQNFVMDIWTDSFIVYIKTDVICKVLQNMLKLDLTTSNYEWDRPLPKGEKSNWINER